VLPVAATTAGIGRCAFGVVALALLMLFYRDGSSIFLLWIPVIAAVQFVFTLAFSFLVAAGNVFFRDLNNVVGHVLRLWWFLSPGLYSIESLDKAGFLKDHPTLLTLFNLNPFAILFTAYRTVIYGTVGPPATGPSSPDLQALVVLLLGSLVFLVFTTFVFKRLEPNFAKVI